MACKWTYQFTQKAKSDLDSIVSYISVELSNPKAASDLLEKLQGVIEEARSFPASGAPVINEFLETNEVRKKFAGNYIVYYFPDSAKRLSIS